MRPRRPSYGSRGGGRGRGGSWPRASSPRLLALILLLLLTATPWVQAFVVNPAGHSHRPPTQLQAAGFFKNAIDNFQADFKLVMEEMKHGTAEGKEEIDRLRDWIEAKVGAKPEDVIHPLFGEIIKDLGYKRVYCISCEKLTSIPVWEKQRIFRKERAQLIAKDIETKLKDNQPLTLPGVITVYEMTNTKEYGLLDGQHRVGALRLLAESGVLSPETHLILVEVFPVEHEDQVKRLFTEINTAQPVNMYVAGVRSLGAHEGLYILHARNLDSIDLPDMADAGEKEIITRAADMLRLEFANCFSPSTNCRIPNVNIDNLRDELFKANVVGRLGMQTADQLLEWVKARNSVLADRDEEHWQKLNKGRKMDTLNKALAKAKTNRFYLGLDRNWMDVVVPGEDE